MGGTAPFEIGVYNVVLVHHQSGLLLPREGEEMGDGGEDISVPNLPMTLNYL